MMDIVTWAEANWYPSRDGPIVLAEHQMRILRHVLTPGPNGRLPYGTTLWSEPNKAARPKRRPSWPAGSR